MPERTIAELAAAGALTFGDGYRTKRAELGRPGLRVLRVADIEQGRVACRGEDFVSVDFLGAMGSKVSKPGDVLLTTKGTVGRVAVVTQSLEPVVYSPQLCYFRVQDRTQIDPRYLGYWFRSPAFSQQSALHANNTDMAAYINLRDVGSLRIDLPCIDRQSEVVTVLGAFDDKIAANRQIVGRCSQLAQAYWESTAREGTPLSDLARFVNGRAFTKDASGTGRVVVRIAELNSGLGASTVRTDIEVAADHVARPGDLLFAWSGSLTVARWYRPEAIINQHIFKVIPNDKVPMWLVDQAVRAKLADFRAIAADKATTMGHIQRAHLDQPVAVPPQPEIDRLNGVMQGLWDRSLAAEVETLQLEKARDELLPLLMSGKVQVRDIQSPLTGEVAR
jgi:type I restriction enzyme S subunit